MRHKEKKGGGAGESLGGKVAVRPRATPLARSAHCLSSCGLIATH